MSSMRDLVVRVSGKSNLKGMASDASKELDATATAAGKAGTKAGNSFASKLKAKSDKAADDVRDKWNDSWSTIGDVAKKGGAAMVLALGAAAGYGLKVAAQNEQAQISFTTLLGSAQKAGSFIKQLQAFAAKTPFDFPGLQQSASQLLAAGISSKKIIPIMTTLGNVTSGMGTGAEGVQRATVAIQQMNAAQKISAEDLNQLRDAGIPVYDLLSKALGKSKTQVAALVQAGKLGKPALDKMMSALTSGKGLERFNGLMQKQSQSLVGMWSTVKDTFGQGLAKAIAPALPGIKSGLNTISNVSQQAFAKLPGMIDGVISKVKEFGKSDTWASILAGFQSLGKIGGQAIGILGKGLPVIGGFISFLVKHNTVFVPLAAGIGALVAGIRIWQGVTKTMTAVQGALNIVMDANPIGLIILGVAALAAGLVVAYKKSETFRNIVNGAWSGIRAGAGAVVKWFTGSFVPFFTKTLPRAFTTVKNAIVSPFKASWDWLAGPFAGFFTKTLPGFFSSAGKAIASPFVAASRTVVGVATGIWNGIEAAFRFGVKIVSALLKVQWKIVDVLIATPLRAAARVVQDAWLKIKGPFTAANVWIGKTFRAGWNKVTGVLTGAVKTAEGWIGGFWRREKTGWTNIATWVGKTFKAAWDKVTGILKGPINTAEGWIRGFWNREKTGWTNIAKWVGSMFRAGWNKITNILKIPVVAGENAIKAGWSGARSAFTAARSWVTGTWSRSWSAVKGKMTGPIQAAKGAIGTLMGRGKSGLQGVFSSAVSQIGKIWNGLKSVAKAPVKFVIDTVLNNGLIAGFNKIAQFAWGNNKHNISPIRIPGFRTGGYTGDGNPNDVAGVAHKREFYFDEQAVRAAGGPRVLERFRRGLKAGVPVGPAAEGANVNQQSKKSLPAHIAAIAARGPQGAGGYGALNPLAYANREVGTMGWYNRCLAFVNAAWNYTVGRFKLATARASADAGPLTLNGTPPAGAAVYWNPNHVALADGSGGVFSNDIITPGEISHVPQSLIGSKWGLPYRGWWSPNGAKGGPGGLLGSIVGAGKNIWGKIKGAVSDPLSLLQGAIRVGEAGLYKLGTSNLVQTIGQLPKKLLADAGGALAGKLGGLLTSGSSFAPAVGNAQQIVHQMMRNMGWGEDQWNPLRTLIQNESGWRDTVRNASSGAFGLFQLLGANYNALGGDHSDAKQAAVGLSYIRQAYGSPANALAKWMSRNPHWYDNGTQGGLLPPGTHVLHNGTGQPETIRTARQEAALNNGPQIVINVNGALDPVAVGRQIALLLQRYERSIGPVQINRRTAAA